MIIIIQRGSALHDYAAALMQLGQKGQTELARGLTEGGLKVRTQVRRALREQTGVRAAGSITKRTTSKSATPGSLEFRISGWGKGIPIKEFPTRYSRSKRAMVRWSPREHWKIQERDADGRFGAMPEVNEAGVSARVWTSWHAFQRSFVTPRGPRAMRPGTKRQLRQLYGPAIPKEITVDKSLQTFMTGVNVLIEPILARRLNAMLPR